MGGQPGERMPPRQVIQDVLHHWLGGPGKAFAVDDITDEIVDALGLEEIGYTFSPDGVAVHHDAPRLDDGQPVYRLNGVYFGGSTHDA